MNTLYLLSRGRMTYVPDEPLPVSLAMALQREWVEQGASQVRHPLTILGEPVRIVDLRPPEPTVDVIALDEATLTGRSFR